MRYAAAAEIDHVGAVARLVEARVGVAAGRLEARDDLVPEEMEARSTLQAVGDQTIRSAPARHGVVGVVCRDQRIGGRERLTRARVDRADRPAAGIDQPETERPDHLFRATYPFDRWTLVLACNRDQAASQPPRRPGLAEIRALRFGGRLEQISKTTEQRDSLVEFVIPDRSPGEVDLGNLQ